MLRSTTNQTVLNAIIVSQRAPTLKLRALEVGESFIHHPDTDETGKEFNTETLRGALDHLLSVAVVRAHQEVAHRCPDRGVRADQFSVALQINIETVRAELTAALNAMKMLR